MARLEELCAPRLTHERYKTLFEHLEEQLAKKIPEHLLSGVRRELRINNSGEHPPLGVKRPLIKCPDCGRRVIAQIRAVDFDGDELVWTIPPHKKRHWFKKKDGLN